MAASVVWMPTRSDVMFAAMVAARRKSSIARPSLPINRTLVALAEMELPPADLSILHHRALNHPVFHPPHPVLDYHQVKVEGVVRHQLL